MTVIPNGANTELFRPGDRLLARREIGLDASELVIGYVGALAKLRHVDRLVRAVRKLGARLDSDVGLVLVGSGDERAALERLAKDGTLSGRARFVGHLPYADVPRYIQVFDVAVDLTAVQMEVRGRIHLSSFSQKIPQYLACGVPVVAWRCIDTMFLVDEGVGAVAQFADEKGLTEALESLFMVPESPNGRKHAGGPGGTSRNDCPR